ncbi:MAG: 16S rRNA (guanine(527)-N(7))-methyltransferase RsmG [Nitrospinae bacterium]|nr:16S rRNA (guanine(527)-N(7))-methyltransferase RsmG [Nitrospinota bacterium]
MKEAKNLLKELSQQVGFPLSEDQCDMFITYLWELRKWNKKINLTAIIGERDIIIKHFINSILFLYAFPSGYIKEVMDIGSGGGFPGIPIKIVRPELSILLVDKSRKKVNFLKHICRLLDLKGINCIAEQAGDMALIPENIERFDIILSKGIGRLMVFLSAVTPLLKRGGLFITQKGDDYQKEIKEVEEIFSMGKGILKEVIPIELPPHLMRYNIIVIQRCST